MRDPCQYREVIRTPEKFVNRSLYGDPEPAAQANVLGELLMGMQAVDEALENASVAQSFEEMTECCENKTAFRVPEAAGQAYLDSVLADGKHS